MGLSHRSSFSPIVCPEAVRFFFSNLRYSDASSRVFTSLVFGHLFTIPVHQVGLLLDIPQDGENLADESELGLFGFDVMEEFQVITGQRPGSDQLIPVRTLLPVLQVFHFFLTQVFLPRTGNLHLLTPLYVWIIAHAVHGTPLDYSPLFFGAILPFANISLEVSLPFGSLITQLLLRLDINLNLFRTSTPTVFFSADDVMDIMQIAVEGENDGVPAFHIISSDDSDSDSDSSDDSDVGSAAGLEPFVAALQDLYGSGSDNEGF
ncbi:unnamed protein product [Linum trigynum]|uniref:Uncharacterized protein n=1 Tax=Linum trigynum TaxID=586398 RepID=A0AAV2E486_9ROSI